MFKYFFVLALAGVVIYAVNHPERLGLDLSSVSGPTFKVWVNHRPIPPNNDRYDTLMIQSREEQPIGVKSVLLNDDPKCVNMDLSPYTAGTPIKLGEVIRFGLGINGFNACEPVKLAIKTDRGSAIYEFK
jgi:hypothetical protein